MVGFGCTKGEIQSKAVTKAFSFLENSEHQELLLLLDSKSKAEQFLAVVLLEKLQANGSITLSKNQKQKIESIYKSKQKVSICSGCTYWDKMPLNEALKNDSKPRRLTNMALDEFVN